MDASLKTEQQRARLVSPVVAADTGPLCLLFSYQLVGEAQGHLKVLLRDAHNEETVLWMLKDDQGPVWREGRTILPRSPKDFQVIKLCLDLTISAVLKYVCLVIGIWVKAFSICLLRKRLCFSGLVRGRYIHLGALLISLSP